MHNQYSLLACEDRLKLAIIFQENANYLNLEYYSVHNDYLHNGKQKLQNTQKKGGNKTKQNEENKKK